ncbi:PREDICTED: uncharacterized protein LOC109115485 [Nelumbo nucifera]|uniref:Uncharacterized protein LOC109115485 n=1 Tax=Nelumbo nucifera TaxID=4432 RepID=A0A1U8Q8M1_NELNU|nr:PREDICTED: uncharacterized protein LOC109115485 [Nelumbo nucifera]
MIVTNRSGNTMFTVDDQISSFSDQNSPFYFHPSDSPGIVLVSCLLNEDNYMIWRRAMINALSTKNKIGFVNGMIQKSDPANQAEFLAWSKCNSMVVSWIFNVLAKDLHENVVHVEHAQDYGKIWKKGSYKEMHQGSFISRDNSCCSGKKISLSLFTSQNSRRFGMNCQATLLDHYVPTGCVLVESRKILLQNRKEKVYQFLLSLIENFNNIRSSILRMDPLPSIVRVNALISQEERHQSLIAQHGPTTEAIAFHVAGSKFNPKRGKRSVVITARNKVTTRTAILNCSGIHRIRELDQSLHPRITLAIKKRLLLA